MDVFPDADYLERYNQSTHAWTKAFRLARGFFITFEGGEGAGKSTQIERLARKMRAKKYDVLVTREPGGSPGAEAVRHVLLSGAAEPFGPKMEALLFAAARSDHVEQVIRPAVERGTIVLCDRFLDSSRVYQGVTGGIEPAFMDALEQVAINGMMPDMTLIFDIDPAEGLRRATLRRSPQRRSGQLVPMQRRWRPSRPWHWRRLAPQPQRRCAPSVQSPSDIQSAASVSSLAEVQFVCGQRCHSVILDCRCCFLWSSNQHS